MAKPRIIIADTDVNYVIPLQLKFAEDFYQKVDLEIITDRTYFDQLFSTPQRVELVVNKDSYVIGKNAAMVDGAVSFNKLISRVHCQIDRRGNEVTVTDLESANGTFVNRVKLIPRKPAVIHNGDVIRMANSDFQVTIK